MVRAQIHIINCCSFPKLYEIKEIGTAQPSFVARQLVAIAAERTPTQDDIDDVRGAASTMSVLRLSALTDWQTFFSECCCSPTSAEMIGPTYWTNRWNANTLKSIDWLCTK
jgi:hypothetical protein